MNIFWMNYEITCHSAGEGAQACREGRKKASVLHTPPQTSAGAAAAGRSSTHAFIDPVSPIIAKKNHPIEGTLVSCCCFC